MARFVLDQLRFRPGRALALAAAILVAAASFSVLSAAGKTTEIRVRGSVESNYRTAYDILVRPRGSKTALEVSQGLVRNNYLSGLFGGITLKQWREVRSTPRVEIAAPVANIGFVIPNGFTSISLNDLLNDEPLQLYRIRYTSVAHNGLSRYPGAVDYVYYTRRNEFAPLTREAGFREVVDGEPLEVCSGSSIGNTSQPFWDHAFRGCYSERSPGLGSDVRAPRKVRVGRGISFPILLAAIDPVEEAKLLHLGDAVVAGRYLRPGDEPKLQRLPPSEYGPNRPMFHRVVPVMASAKTYVTDYVEARIERLRIPAGAEVPRILASERGDDFLRSLEGDEIARRRISAEETYENALDGVFGNTGPKNVSRSYWTASPTRYRQLGPLHIAPLPVENPPAVWRADPYPGAAVTYQQAPRANADVQFRRLSPRIGSIYWDEHEVPGGMVWKTPVMGIVGRYDPEKLPGFSPLSEVPLETYYPPELRPANEASRRALGGKPLLPSQNIGDYVAQPPLFLTTLEGMRPFLRPKYYEGASEAAPISVIRVRVAGVTGPDELSQARVRQVATGIHERTGLDVDITAGSSPRRLLVELPPGKFGRPGLLLEEGWSKKGVSVSFLQGLDRKRLGLVSLILVTCTFFLANGAFAAVRGRRTEIGTLLSVGWPRRAVFGVVLAELIVIGLVAGLLAASIAVGAATAFSLDLTVARALLGVPLAVALAAVAGVVPAWRAARLAPLEAVRPAVSAPSVRRRVRRLLGLALANVRRMPARTAVAASGLFVGSAALTLLVAINAGFQGRLVGTLLGEAISVRVRPLDFLVVGVIVLLAALSLADVLYLNLRERAAEFVTLRTVGWSDRHLAQVIATEAVVLALLGTFPGVAVGAGVGLALGAGGGPVLLGSLASVAGGLLLALLASLLPLSRLAQLTAPTVLADE